MSAHEKINYVEFPSRDLEATKRFFESAFGWTFVDYGPDYTSFADQGLDGGFFRADLAAVGAASSRDSTPTTAWCQVLIAAGSRSYGWKSLFNMLLA